jgi:hypothetical protein
MSDTEFAKTHLREHLGNLLVSPISEGFWSIYNSAKELCDKNGQAGEILRTFQNMLTRIPEWSEVTLGTEVERIQKVSKCSYLDDLIMGVFISYMKSFASLNYSESSELKIDFDRPSVAKFVHELYKHSARKLWQIAYLFRTVGTTSEQQARNRQEIEKVVSDCMENVITAFLPWESITKKYFSQSGESSAPQLPKAVSFGEKEEKEVEDEEEDSDSDSDEDKPNLVVSDEVATIEIEDLDKPKLVEVKVPQEEVDPLEELSKRATETLVLNL